MNMLHIQDSDAGRDGTSTRRRIITLKYTQWNDIAGGRVSKTLLVTIH